MTAPNPALKLGTRGSPLALAQAHETRRLLAAAHGLNLDSFEIVVIKTSGDMIQDRSLMEAGGKGLFTKELDDALLSGNIDLAVHSAKDMPTLMPDGIEISGYLPREDARDVFISSKFDSLMALPQGARLGSASLRRQAQALKLRPDLQPALLRGNVETRLKKIETGLCDCTFLALAGLKRLGLAHHATQVLDMVDFLPAVGQGAIALTARTQDKTVSHLIGPILHAETTAALTCERAFLQVLDGSCRTPIAGYGHIHAGRLQFRGEVYSVDGKQTYDVAFIGLPENAARIGEDAGRELLKRAPQDFLQR